MIAARVVKGDGSETRLCLERAIREADQLIASLAEEDVALLNGHRGLLAERLAEMNSHGHG